MVMAHLFTLIFPTHLKLTTHSVPEDDNPVGSYIKIFTAPHDWNTQDVFIEFGVVSSAFTFG